MTPALVPISGLRGKAPACFLVEAKGARILLDLGYGPDPGQWPDVSGIGRVDAVLLSHSHPDHAGGLELLAKLGTPRVYASDIVRKLLPAGVRSDTLPLHGRTSVCGVRMTTGRSGHAPGGIWLHLEVGGGLLYMGDSCDESLVYVRDPVPEARTAIIDCSYGAYDVPLEDCAPAFDHAFDAGPVLLPVPAAGRGPEMALHVYRRARGIPHIDEAMRGRLRQLAGEERGCLREGVAELLAKLADDALPIDGPRGAMFAGHGDATGGTAGRCVAEWEHAATPAIVFTGYLTPGTPAERLTRSGRARYLRWNVHPRLSDNARLVREARAAQVLPAFGDAKHAHAWERAFAPAKVIVDGRVTL